ncbi:50S ribosomal protein L6 [Candidatus Nomurabacteria bacterium]|nr:50S ribosomal protein L6 [Candidatus Nomurabacteria bacterium]
MSRVGKQQLQIPEKTEVSYEGGIFRVKGPLGTLEKPFKDVVTITIENGAVTFAPKGEDPFSRSIWGTYASHVKNMLAGVATPYTKKLILEGVGFKSEVKGKELHLALGFSHPVIVAIPEGLTVIAEKNVITISGIDKELVGEFAASTRALKKPEPYKGKGFRYDDEVIRRKQGKKTA